MKCIVCNENCTGFSHIVENPYNNSEPYAIHDNCLRKQGTMIYDKNVGVITWVPNTPIKVN
jgi:hypothetical protein